MELPFPLRKCYRTDKKADWKKLGLLWENDLAFSIVYKRHIFARQCELCQKVFTKKRDRHMEHDHNTGKFRNIVCAKCNLRKADVKKRDDNTSGHKGICWDKDKNGWRFQVNIDGKQKYIKRMKDLDELIEFVDQWKIDNNYHT
jgi:hypothetical protein